MFPQPGGLLTFATCELKYTFWWRVVGPPDGWPTLLQDDGATWHRYELTATELLAVALRDELFLGGEKIDEATFFSHPEGPRERHQPFAIIGWGSSRESFDHHEIFYVELDLAGALGGTRQGHLDGLLAALDGSLRERIVRAEAKRGRAILYVRSRDDFEPVRKAVQAWADRVSDTASSAS